MGILRWFRRHKGKGYPRGSGTCYYLSKVLDDKAAFKRFDWKAHLMQELYVRKDNPDFLKYHDRLIFDVAYYKGAKVRGAYRYPSRYVRYVDVCGTDNLRQLLADSVDYFEQQYKRHV